MNASISFEDYRRKSFRPDREYVDGQVLKRRDRVGSWNHARMLSLLAGFFVPQEEAMGLVTLLNGRVLVQAERVRIPCVTLVRRGRYGACFLTEAPALVVELISASSLYTETQGRVRDYLGMGVRTVWLIDPACTAGWVCSRSETTETQDLIAEGVKITCHLPSILAELQFSRCMDRATREIRRR